MIKLISIISCFILFSCKTTTWFVVRHAEKETSTMSTDVSLTPAGSQRAEALKELLKKEHIHHIYSTNFIRTKSTAQPLATATNIAIEIYDPRDTSFAGKIRNINSGNFLIVGHSNTVDDIVNKLSGKVELQSDLPDTQYGDLFIIKKRGQKFSFLKSHFGQ